VRSCDLVAGIVPDDWKTFTFRYGTKGPMTRQVHTRTVYLWNAKSADPMAVEKYTLVISRNTDGSEVKYSVSNDVDNPDHPLLAPCDLLRRQMNRYWVERGLQDCKDTLGMTEYQVRSWMAFHHHITLTIMALHYMLLQKVECQTDKPLLSCPDIKFILSFTLPKKATTDDQLWKLVDNRHRQRQADIDRRSKKAF
jgi:hypothetical protein